MAKMLNVMVLWRGWKAEVYRFLKQAGCFYAQGYFFEADLPKPWNQIDENSWENKLNNSPNSFSIRFLWDNCNLPWWIIITEKRNFSMSLASYNDICFPKSSVAFRPQEIPNTNTAADWKILIKGIKTDWSPKSIDPAKSTVFVIDVTFSNTTNYLADAPDYISRSEGFAE